MNKHEEKLKQYIKESKIKAEHLLFKETCHSVKEAAKAVKAKEEDVVKSICILDSEENNLIVAIVSGTDRVSLENVINKLNIKTARIAKPKEILEFSGYPVGGVPPFGFKAKFLIDEKVIEKEIVYAGGGSEKSLIKISPKEIQKANEGDIGKIRE